MFILFTNLFLARPFRLENTLECYNLRGGQGGSTEVVFFASGQIYYISAPGGVFLPPAGYMADSMYIPIM
jgi:hypothetical protein